MIWFWVFLPVLIALAYLLLAPVYIEVDTTADLYRVRFHKFASTALLITGNSILINLKIAWWQKRIDLFAPEKQPRNKKQKPAKRAIRRRRVSFRTIRALVKTFKVKHFYLTADSGDPAFNGRLYPVVYAIRVFSGQNVSVNFSGRNEIVLKIENNLARVIRAFIYSSLKTRTWKI